MKTLAAICMLLTGCASLPGARMPSAEVDRVIGAWRDAGLPYTDTCSEQRGDVHVVVADGALFADLCRHELQPGRYESCSIGPLLVVGPAYNRPGYRVHEMLHFLSACGLQDPDAGHTNATIWIGPSSLLKQLGG